MRCGEEKSPQGDVKVWVRLRPHCPVPILCHCQAGIRPTRTPTCIFSSWSVAGVLGSETATGGFPGPSCTLVQLSWSNNRTAICSWHREGEGLCEEAGLGQEGDQSASLPTPHQEGFRLVKKP